MLDEVVAFGPFRLDPRAGLTQGKRDIRLTPKALALLCLLTAERERVVGKDELFDTLWPGAPVGDAALVTCIQELRKALGDDARHPRYIETLHRRGYRFIAEPADASPRRWGRHSADWEEAILVDRDHEFAQLADALALARAGTRQIVMVTGAAGIGKTALVRTFLARATQEGAVRIAWGQSAEHYGASEPYHCVLDALMRACRETWGERLIAALDRFAPLWLTQMPTLVGPVRLRALQRRTTGATRERMQREITAAIEAVSAEAPIVLWLEDLHWADASTIDWLATFARRPESANVLAIGTYRADEASAASHAVHALRDEMRRQGHARELALSRLSSTAVARYVGARFIGLQEASPSLSNLATEIHSRTGGSPLFMVGVLNELVAKGVLECREGTWTISRYVDREHLSIPRDLWQSIDREIERIASTAVHVLEVASAIGLDFSAAAVAVGASCPIEAVEITCHDMARRHQFLEATGTEEWPDGTIASRFRFIHALYREALYERLPAGRKVALHREIGLGLARGYGDRADEIATQLAMHFERARDLERAVLYLEKAGAVALRRHASREAVTHLGRAVELLRTLAPSRLHDECEVSVRLTMSAPLIAIHGFGSTLVEENAQEALKLCDGLNDRHRGFAAHRVIWNHSLMRHTVPIALIHARELMAAAEASQAPVRLALAHRALGCTLIHAGKLEEADLVLERGIVFADATPDQSFAPFGEHPGMICRAFGAWAKALRGFSDQAARFIDDGVAHARRRDEPHGLAFALVTVGLVHLFQRDVENAERVAGEVLDLAQQHKLPQWIAFGQEIQGWAIWQRGDAAAGIELMEQSLLRLQATGARSHRSRMLANLAESCLAAGRLDTARIHLDAAFKHRREHGEQYYAPELLRLRALILQRGGAAVEDVEALLAEALLTAQRQGATLLARRVAQTRAALMQV